jgi:hypothetical protein
MPEGFVWAESGACLILRFAENGWLRKLCLLLAKRLTTLVALARVGDLEPRMRLSEIYA